MKTTNPTTTPTSPAKRRLAKAITVGLVGALLLTATGTRGGWRDTAQIAAPDTAITAGALTLEASATSAWTLNGAAVPEAELSAVNLVPGDVLAYVGSHTPNLTGDLEAWMYFTGVEAITGELSESPAASQAWSVAGKQEAKKITSADSGTGVATGYEIRMAPIGDPVYATGTEGEALVLDVSRVKVVLSMVNPGGGGEASELGWGIPDPALKAAVVKQLTGQSLSGQALDEHNLTMADAAALNRLDASQYTEIASLAGLEAATNLTFLDFRKSPVSDLSHIAGLSKLEFLYAFETNISDLTPLTNLKNLTNLGIAGTKVSDVGALAYLPNLRFLIAQKLSVSDWTPVAHVTNVLK